MSKLYFVDEIPLPKASYMKALRASAIFVLNYTAVNLPG